MATITIPAGSIPNVGPDCAAVTAVDDSLQHLSQLLASDAAVPANVTQATGEGIPSTILSAGQPPQLREGRKQ